MITISTGDFYYLPKDSSIYLVTAFSDSRVRLVCVTDDYDGCSVSPNYIYSYARYLGNIATTPTSQLKNFYPELFI